MIPVVFDCGILVSAIGWAGNPRRCLRLVADRQIRLCATPPVWDEYERRIPAILAGQRPGVDPLPTLNWLLGVARFVNPTPLGKRRGRDLKDERYLACALGADAEFIVSNDRDLLALQKPFGIAVVTPIQLLLHVRGKGLIGKIGA